MGDHLIAARSRVQPRIALIHMIRDFKTNEWGRIVHDVDARACRAIVLRRGGGGLKHIIVKSLWVQEAVSVSYGDLRNLS